MYGYSVIMPMASMVFISYCAENTIYGHNYIFFVSYENQFSQVLVHSDPWLYPVFVSSQWGWSKAPINQ